MTYELAEVFSHKNVWEGYIDTRKGKRKKPCVIDYEKDDVESTRSLSVNLINKRHVIDDYHNFYVYEPKKRLIKAPSFNDRVMQRTLCKQILEPVIEKHLIYDTYACRVDKGTHAGLYRLEHFMKKHYRKYGREGWVIKGDIAKYFYSISHEILKAKLYPLLKDYDIEWLLEMIIDSTESPGIPLGNQSSQWFANFYLSCFDHFVKEVLGVKHYIRYMDDFVLILETKKEAQTLLKIIKQYLWEELRLETNAKTQIFPLKNGIDFLGFHSYITESGRVYRKIRRDSKVTMMRKLRKFKTLYELGLIDKEAIDRSYASWKGHAGHGNTKGLFKETDRLYEEIFEGDENIWLNYSVP